MLFEILIPLVLFLILMGIRLHKPPKSNNESKFLVIMYHDSIFEQSKYEFAVMSISMTLKMNISNTQA